VYIQLVGKQLQQTQQSNAGAVLVVGEFLHLTLAIAFARDSLVGALNGESCFKHSV